MAKAPASDSIMSLDKMKPLLALSKAEPVQAAIGLTSDGEGIILLDKKAKPKKVFSLLKASAAKARLQLNNASLRFGRAEVDTEYDSGMVRFFVNKDAPGNLRIKLVEIVKRIPYQKVEINVDPSLEAEPEDDEEPGVGATEAQAAPADMQPPPTGAAPTQAAERPDPTKLAAELTALARRIPEAAGADAALRAKLLKFATDANANIKSDNLADAANFISELRDALRDALEAAGVTVGQVSPGHGQGGAQGPDASSEQMAAGGAVPTADAQAAELRGLIGRLQAVAAHGTPLFNQLLMLANTANNIPAADAARKAAAIGQLREAMDAAGSGPATPGATQATAGVEAAKPGTAEPADGVVARLQAAYDKLAPALTAAALATPAIAEGIEMHRTGFQAALSSGDSGAARDHLFELSALSKSTGAAEAAAVIPEGTVAAGVKALEDVRQRWDGALVEAHTGSHSLQTELEAASATQAEGFERILDSYWSDLADVINAASGQDATGFDAIRQTSENLRGEMMADDLLSYLDQNGVPVRPAFIAALDDVDNLLRP